MINLIQNGSKNYFTKYNKHYCLFYILVCNIPKLLIDFILYNTFRVEQGNPKDKFEPKVTSIKKVAQIDFVQFYKEWDLIWFQLYVL